MNLCTKWKHSHRELENRLVVARKEGVGERWVGSLRLADSNQCI